MSLRIPRLSGRGRRVGLSVSDTTVHAVEVSGAASSTVVTASAAGGLAPGVVVQGTVRDAAAFASTLEALWAQGSFGAREVIVGLGPHEAFVRAIDLPKLRRSLRSSALGFELEDMLPFPRSEAIIDHHQIHTGLRDEETDRFLVVAAHVPSLSPVIEGVARAGLRLRALDVPAFASVRAAQALRSHPEVPQVGATAVVAIGAELLTVTIHEHGAVRFTRQVPVSPALGTDLSGLLESELSTINAHLGSQMGPARGAGRDPIVDAVHTTIEFEGQVGRTEPVGEIEVFGGGPVASALFMGLREHSSQPVEHISAWPASSDRRPVDADWIAMGHAMSVPDSLGPGWPRVLPDQRVDRIRTNVAVAVGSALLGAAAAAAAVTLAGPPVAERAGELEALEVDSAAVQAQLDDLGPAVQESAELNRTLAAVEEIRAGSVDWDALLREIRARRPEGSRLVSFEGSAEDLVSAQPAGLQLTVESAEPSAVEDWLAMLATIDSLGEPVLESVTSTGAEDVVDTTAGSVFSIRTTVAGSVDDPSTEEGDEG